MSFLSFLPKIIGGAVKGIKWIAKKVRERRERRRREKAQKAFQAQQQKTGNPWSQTETKTGSPWGKFQKIVSTGREVLGKVQEGLQEEAANNPKIAKASEIMGKISDVGGQIASGLPQQ